MKRLQGKASQKQLTGHLFTKWHILNLRLFTVLNEDKISQEKGNYLSRTRPSKDERNMRLELYFSLFILQWCIQRLSSNIKVDAKTRFHSLHNILFVYRSTNGKMEDGRKPFIWSRIKVKHCSNIFISHNYKYNAHLKNFVAS